MRFPGALLALLVAAAVAAAGQPDPAEIPELIRRLGDQEYAVREEATRRLRELGAAAREALQAAAKHEDAEVRDRARMLLRELRWGISPELKARLGGFAEQFERYLDSPQESRLRLLSELRNRAPDAAERYLLQAAEEEEEPRARAWLANLLGIYRSSAAQKAVLAASREENRYCRSAAATALAGFEDAEATARLVELLTDTDPTVRRAATESLGKRGSFAAACREQVAKRLADGDETVRSAAAGALGRMGCGESLEELWKLVGDREVSVRVEALQAIGRLAPPGDAGCARRLAAALDDQLPAVRAVALTALLAMRGRSEVPKLVALMDDGDTDIAAEAIRALTVLGGEKEVAELRKVLAAGEYRELRAEAARALIIMGDRQSLPAAAKLLSGDDATAASVVARALGLTGDLQWAAKLAEAQEHWKSASFAVTALEVRAVQLREPKTAKLLADHLAGHSGTYLWSGFLTDHALFAEAADTLARGASTSLDEPEVLGQLGVALIQAGRAEEGMGKLRAAAKMDPFDGLTLNNLAWFLLTCSDAAQRRPEEGLEVAARAARLRPRTGYVLDTYAWALHRNGKPKEALEVIEEALRWSLPDNPGERSILRAHRARILVAGGRRDEALGELAATLARFPRDPELALEAARAFCDLGMPDRAIAELTRTLELTYPDVVTIKQDPELEAVRKQEGFRLLLERAEAARAELRRQLLGGPGAAGAPPVMVAPFEIWTR
jgi:HEAT repeat protein/Flp pilus assembly protein TadD